MLSSTQKNEIKTLIKAVELKSSAEIVAVISQKSMIFSNFLPKSIKLKFTKILAKNKFKKLNLHHTKDRLGVMFFVSIKDKCVHILSDVGIKEKISDESWAEVVEEFIKFVKKDEFAKGYIQAIKRSSKMLVENFPIRKNDINELLDEVIEI